MIHEKGRKLIADLERIGAVFEWEESKDNAGSPEIIPATPLDRSIIMTYLDEKTAEDEHAYSLMVGSGGIVAK